MTVGRRHTVSWALLVSLSMDRGYVSGTGNVTQPHDDSTVQRSGSVDGGSNVGHSIGDVFRVKAGRHGDLG